MNEKMRTPGKTTIAPEVLVTIAKLTTLSVKGVSRLAPVSSNDVNLLFTGAVSDGVKISVEKNTVYADLFVVLQRDNNVREISSSIQQHVSRAISEMVGMEVGKVNIHIEDIDYATENLANQ